MANNFCETKHALFRKNADEFIKEFGELIKLSQFSTEKNDFPFHFGGNAGYGGGYGGNRKSQSDEELFNFANCGTLGGILYKFTFDCDSCIKLLAHPLNEILLQVRRQNVLISSVDDSRHVSADVNHQQDVDILKQARTETETRLSALEKVLIDIVTRTLTTFVQFDRESKAANLGIRKSDIKAKYLDENFELSRQKATTALHRLANRLHMFDEFEQFAHMDRKLDGNKMNPTLQLEHEFLRCAIADADRTESALHEVKKALLDENLVKLDQLGEAASKQNDAQFSLASARRLALLPFAVKNIKFAICDLVATLENAENGHQDSKAILQSVVPIFTAIVQTWQETISPTVEMVARKMAPSSESETK